MSRAMIVHALLLVGALALAFVVWTGDAPDAGDEAPVLLALDPSQIQSLQYTWPEGETRVSSSGTGEARSFTVALTRQIVTKKPAAASRPASSDGGLAEDAAAAADVVDEVRTESSTFPAGSAVTQALDKLAPLTALRSLGQVDASQLARMGLVTPTRMLQMNAGARSFTLEIGDKTYGAQGHYARLKGRDEVVLIASTVVNGLEGSESRLMEWRVLPVEIEQITGVDLRTGTRSGRLLHVDREQPQKRHFALASTPDQKSDEAGSLVNRLRGLRASRYRAEPPLPGTFTEAAALTVQRADGAPLNLSVLESTDGSGYVVRTGAWIAEVNTAQARGVLDDLAAVLPP